MLGDLTPVSDERHGCGTPGIVRGVEEQGVDAAAGHFFGVLQFVVDVELNAKLKAAFFLGVTAAITAHGQAVKGYAVALQPVFCNCAVGLVPVGDQVDQTSLVREAAEGFGRLFAHGNAGKDLIHAGSEELVHFFAGLVEGLLDIVGCFEDRFAEVGAGGLQPDVAGAVIVVGEYSIYVKTENELPDGGAPP